MNSVTRNVFSPYLCSISKPAIVIHNIGLKKQTITTKINRKHYLLNYALLVKLTICLVRFKRNQTVLLIVLWRCTDNTFVL